MNITHVGFTTRVGSNPRCGLRAGAADAVVALRMYSPVRLVANLSEADTRNQQDFKRQLSLRCYNRWVGQYPIDVEIIYHPYEPGMLADMRNFLADFMCSTSSGHYWELDDDQLGYFRSPRHGWYDKRVRLKHEALGEVLLRTMDITMDGDTGGVRSNRAYRFCNLMYHTPGSIRPDSGTGMRDDANRNEKMKALGKSFQIADYNVFVDHECRTHASSSATLRGAVCKGVSKSEAHKLAISAALRKTWAERLLAGERYEDKDQRAVGESNDASQDLLRQEVCQENRGSAVP